MKLLNKTQSGRSMVEMLGVLAIIGVLSVGGIAGYSKAMFKHKMNQTMDFISQVVANIVTLDGKDIGFIETAQDAISSGILPNCDVNYVNVYGQKGYSCPIPLGEISVGVFPDGYGNIVSAEIGFMQNPQESCVSFLNSEFYKNVPDSWWKDDVYGTNGGYIVVRSDKDIKHVYSKSTYILEYYSNEGVKDNLTPTDIANACNICHDVEICYIDIQMYIK